MSLTSPFEVARSTHEEAERYSAALASILNTLPSSSTGPPTRSSLINAHLASIVTDRIVSRNRNLVDFYNDESGIKKDEEMSLAGEGDNDGNGGDDTAESTMNLFYARLRHIQQHHEKYPAAPPETFSLDLNSLQGLIAPSDSGVGVGAGSSSSGAAETDPVDRLFSGEEGLGRYLDLYEYHSQYTNLKGVKRITYLAYLDKFHRFDEINVSVKKTDAYGKYLAALLQYLVAYLRKIRPLDDVDGQVMHGAEKEFEEKWNISQVVGWEDQGKAFASATDTPQQKQKQAQVQPTATDGAATDGIWCEACQKSFSKQTVFDGHLQGNKHKKAAERMQGGGQANGGTSTSAIAPHLLTQAHTLALQEYTIHHLITGPLSVHRNDTRSNVERRAALTEKERAAEAEELSRQRLLRRETGGDGTKHTGANSDSDSDSDDSDSKVYNPKKLPLGWDGRPIPVWLYKLHGLSKVFDCEICSNHNYHGRKNFDRHFSESRHVFGLRALGLPNSRAFHGVTSIQDALALADKLKKEAKSGGGTATAAAASLRDNKEVEEVEDENGNTYSRKDYELLKRQGLI